MLGTQTARHRATQHACHCGLRTHAPISLRSGRIHVDSRAAWSRVAGRWSITRHTSSPWGARLGQPPNATGNGASGRLTVAISGATGLIGTRLVDKLTAEGHTVLVLTRDSASALRKLRYPNVKVFDPADWKVAVSGADAVVNLAGEPIATRWNEEIKQRIMSSRVGTTRTLVDAINSIPKESRPKVLVSSSAVGFYGASETATFDEASPTGSDYLAQVCQKWEAEANKVDTRLVVLRIGIVMSKEGGALAKMLPAFEMFAGGPMGNGLQWMSWVHIDDLVGLVAEAVANDTYAGVYNGTSPNPVRMNDLCASIAAQLNRPSLVPLPAFALRFVLAEGAETVLKGQRVLPKKAQAGGYEFKFKRIQDALKSILG